MIILSWWCLASIMITVFTIIVQLFSIQRFASSKLKVQLKLIAMPLVLQVNGHKYVVWTKIFTRLSKMEIEQISCQNLQECVLLALNICSKCQSTQSNRWEDISLWSKNVNFMRKEKSKDHQRFRTNACLKFHGNLFDYFWLNQSGGPTDQQCPKATH